MCYLQRHCCILFAHMSLISLLKWSFPLSAFQVSMGRLRRDFAPTAACHQFLVPVCCCTEQHVLSSHSHAEAVCVCEPLLSTRWMDAFLQGFCTQLVSLLLLPGFDLVLNELIFRTGILVLLHFCLEVLISHDPTSAELFFSWRAGRLWVASVLLLQCRCCVSVQYKALLQRGQAEHAVSMSLHVSSANYAFFSILLIFNKKKGGFLSLMGVLWRKAANEGMMNGPIVLLFV